MDEVTLVYIDEAGVQRTTPLPSTGLSLGRARDNGLAFPSDAGVSRYHAEVAHDGDDWVLTDRGSSRGTFVNDMRVTEHLLSDGDVIQLGPPPSPTMWFRRIANAVANETTTTEIGAGLGSEPMTVMAPNASLFLNPAKLMRASAAERGASTTKLAERIKALYQITSSLLSVSDTEELCSRLIDMLFEALPADRCALLLTEDGEQLVQRCLRTRPGQNPEAFVPSRTISLKVAQENVAVLSLDASTDGRFNSGQSVFMQSIRAVMCAPVSSMQSASHSPAMQARASLSWPTFPG